MLSVTNESSTSRFPFTTNARTTEAWRDSSAVALPDVILLDSRRLDAALSPAGSMVNNAISDVIARHFGVMSVSLWGYSKSPTAVIRDS